MTPNQLLSSAVELGMELLESSGRFAPFCKAVDADGASFIYTPGTAAGSDFTTAQAFDSVLVSVRQDLEVRRFVAIAFCFDSRVRLSGEDERVPAIEVELHSNETSTTIFYFTYSLQNGKARILKYYTNPGRESLFVNS